MKEINNEKNVKETQAHKVRTNKRIFIIPVLVAITALTICVTSLAAFFSDMASGGGNVTTGTLDITGTYAFFVNGDENAVANVANFNPGDVIVVRATVGNAGNKSAWVRDGITIPADAENTPYLMPFIDVYTGAKTTAQIAAAPSDGKLSFSDGYVYSANRVINGSGANAEVETHDTYDIIGASNYVAEFTIYFRTDADNSAQNKTISFTAFTQALQYRNNNDTQPNSDAWGTVVSSPFGD